MDWKFSLANQIGSYLTTFLFLYYYDNELKTYLTTIMNSSKGLKIHRYLKYSIKKGNLGINTVKLN